MEQTGTESKNTQEPKLSKEEQKLVKLLEKHKGRKLTQQETSLALAQAHELGELDDEDDGDQAKADPH